jgi:PEGA domain
MKRWPLLFVTALSWCAATRAARADEAVIATGGSATEHDRATVAAAAEAVARDDGWSVRAKPLSKKETESLLTCQDSVSPWTCVPGSLHANGAYRALILTVDGRQTDAGAPVVVVVGKLIAPDTHAFAVKQRHCVQCADDKLGAAAADLTLELLRDIAVREGRTIIEVRSTPNGAQVSLDGRPVQVTDAALNTYPGQHVVVIEKPHYQREIREITVARGKTAELAVVLRQSETTTDDHTSSRPSRVVPFALIGVGAAAVVTGIILYAVDEDPSPTGGKRYWDTAPAGVTVGSIGLAAAAVGTYLLYRDSRTPLAPSVAVLPRGAFLTWTGSF